MSDPLPSASSSSSSSAEGAANGSDSTSASSLSKPPPPPPPPVPPPTKTTPALHSSLTALHSLLTCPLCHETYSTPSTLSCGHTFCLDCIGHYACDNWECPKEGCSQPISMGGPGGGGLGRRNYSGTEAEGGGDEMRRAGGGGVGGRGGGFARTNPILEGSVTSLNRILRVLNDAPDGWWKDSDKSAKRKGKKKKKKKEQNQKEKKKEQQQQRIREKQDDEEEEGEEGGGRRNGRKSAVTFQEDEEEMVDFNPTPNDNDGGDADADDGDGDDDDDSITVSDDIGGTPFGDNTGTITGRPHRSNKPIEEVVCPSQATSASLSANHSQTQSQATNATALPSERDSLLQGLGLGLTDRSVEEPNDATSSAGNGRSSGIPLSHTSGILPSSQQQHPQYSSRLDTTALPAQRDSLLADLDLGLDLGPTDPTGSNEGEGEGVDDDFCTATSRQDNDDGQMTDGTNGTRSTMNTNQYLTGREEDADDMEEAQGGDDDDDEDGDDNDNDGGMDSEATMSYPFPGPSPATERKSNTRTRSSRGGSSNNNSSNNLRQLAQLSRCDTLNSVASSIGAAAGGGREAGNNLSTLEEGSCETSTANTTHSSTKASTAAAEGEGRDRRRGSVEERKGAAEMDQDSDHSDDEQQEEPSQCQSLLGQVNKMERQLDSALADAIRSPSPRADRSGSRSGLDQSCAIPQGDDFVEDDEEGPVFGSQGLSPILIAGSQRDVGFGSDEDERESEGEGEGEDSKPASQSKSIKSKERDPVRESIGSLNTSASSRLATQPPSPDTVKEKETRSSRRSGGYSEEPETSPPDKGAKRKASSRPFMRQYTVSAASKPEVFLLSDFSALTTADVRAIRKCLKQNLVGILKPLVEANEEDSNVATGVDGNSDLDLSFDFETPDGRDSFLTTLASKKAAGVGLYGVCSDSVFALADGYVVPRSFRYLLAVASAIPMVDLSYLSNNSSGKGGRGSSPRYLLPPGSSENDNDVRSGKRARRETSRTSKDPSINPDTNLPYIVYGDCDSKEYGAPQRSLASANGLFDGYVCLFFGEFDHCASKSARVGGRKRARTTNVNDCDLYSEGRLSLLLKLCGGAVANLKQVVEAMEASGSSGTSSARLSPDTNEIVNIFNSSRIRQDRLIIILRTKANARDRKLARKFLAHHSGSSGSISYLNEAPVVCADWALDSIGEFAVQDLATYQ